jgi:PIN domain nuclease of toxin-antitoxin system
VAVLVDTHILLDLLGAGESAGAEWAEQAVFVSVASLWEVAIKVRQGKLKTDVPVVQIEESFAELGGTWLSASAGHAVAELDRWPDTNDPFDRLLLAVCQVEGLQLVTRDRKLVDHPLAWKPAAG